MVDNRNIFVGAPDQLVTAAIVSSTTEAAPTTWAEFEALDLEDWTPSGYIGDGGFNLTPNISLNDIKDMSQSTQRKALSGFDAEVDWEHLELNRFTAPDYFNDVTFAAATAEHGNQWVGKVSAKSKPVKAWLFRVKDDNARIVLSVPRGQINNLGAINFVGGAAIKLPVTQSTYPDAFGNHAYLLFDDGRVTSIAPEEEG